MNADITRIEARFQEVLNKMTTSGVSLTTIEGYLDGLEGYLDGVETLIGTTNSSLATLNLKDFATQTTLAALLTELMLKPDATDIVDVRVDGQFSVSGSITQLTAPGTSPALDITGTGDCTMIVKVANINTSVSFQLEASTNGVDFVSIGSATSVLSNGNYRLTAGFRAAYIRLNFISEFGGTSATLDASYYAF